MLCYPNINLYSIRWNDDFSKARNYAISKCQTEWIFFVDADEFFTREYVHQEFVDFLSSINLYEDSEKIVLCPQIVDKNQNVSKNIKRIFKVKNIKYFGLIHEEPRYCKEAISEKLECVWLTIKLSHDGYDDSVMKLKNKTERNVKLILKMMDIEPFNMKWIYYYLRDNEQYITDKDINMVIEKYMLIDSSQSFQYENLKIDDFTFPVLDIVARYKLNQRKFDDILNYIECLNKLIPNNSNYIFYLNVYKLIKIKMEMCGLLENVMCYRKEHFETQIEMLHSEGAHIDFLLAILLFENGFFNQAMNYFELVKGQYGNGELESYYFDLLESAVDVIMRIEKHTNE